MADIAVRFDMPCAGTGMAIRLEMACRATGMRWITVDVDDLDPIVARCGNERFQMPLTAIRAGLRVCIVEDPDGNAIELVERRAV